MQGNLYFVAVQDVDFTTTGDFFEIIPAASRPIVLHEAKITQSTEAGDSEAEMIKFALKRGLGSTSGSGGSSPTEVGLQSDAPAFAGATEAGNTTPASAGGGTLLTLWEIEEHIANGLHYLPAPEHRPVFKDDEVLVLSMESTPADSITFSGYLIVEEI